MTDLGLSEHCEACYFTDQRYDLCELRRSETPHRKEQKTKHAPFLSLSIHEENLFLGIYEHSLPWPFRQLLGDGAASKGGLCLLHSSSLTTHPCPPPLHASQPLRPFLKMLTSIVHS